MFSFHGEAEHSLDDKGRVIIPKAYREAVADGVFLTRGVDGCLWLFTQAKWGELSAKLQDLGFAQHDLRQFERLLYSGVEGALDNQGRLLVPPSLRAHADLETGSPVVIVGVKNRIELWNPEKWRGLATVLKEESPRFAEPLAEMGI